jgi:hypothetical protein
MKKQNGPGYETGQGLTKEQCFLREESGLDA